MTGHFLSKDAKITLAPWHQMELGELQIEHLAIVLKTAHRTHMGCRHAAGAIKSAAAKYRMP